MPKNIRRFAWLWGAACLVGSTWFLLPHQRLSPPRNLSVPALIALVAVAFAISLFLFWETVWRRKNYARWALFALFALALPKQIIYATLEHSALQMAVRFVVLLLEAAAFFFVFTGDAKAWFHPEYSK